MSGIYSLIYVSLSLLTPPNIDEEILAIANVSNKRNAAAAVTGALLYTGERFAQVLEGPQHAVLEIMDDIARDPRHTDVTILESGTDRRQFEHWSMLYLGRSTFGDTTVQRARAGKEEADELALGNLRRLLRELARSSDSPR